jgi:mono/diheme cytochrome c family protein
MKYLPLLLLVACGAAAPVATATDEARARAQWPSITVDELNQGRKLFLSHCSACHALPDTTQDTASHVPEMRERAHLSEDEGTLIEHYVVTMASR